MNNQPVLCFRLIFLLWSLHTWCPRQQTLLVIKYFTPCRAEGINHFSQTKTTELKLSFWSVCEVTQACGIPKQHPAFPQQSCTVQYGTVHLLK